MLLTKLACTNGGICVMENLFPLIVNLIYWEFSRCFLRSECDLFDNDVIMLEDTTDGGEDCGCFFNEMACGEEGRSKHYLALCNKFVDMYLGTLTREKPKYQNMLPSANRENHMVECWARAYVGTGALGPYEGPLQRESLGGYWAIMRDLLFHRVGVILPSLLDRFKRVQMSRQLNVLMNRKEGRRTIANFEEVEKWTREFQLSIDDSNTPFHTKVNVISWENVEGGLAGQLKLLSNTDIWISPGGGGSINAVFLPDATSALIMDLCMKKSDGSAVGCLDFDTDVLHQFQPHYKIFSYKINDLASELRESIQVKEGTNVIYLDIVVRENTYKEVLAQLMSHSLSILGWRARKSKN